MEALLEETRADELMLTGNVYDHAARLRSFELTAEVLQRLNEVRRGSLVEPAV